MQSIAFFFFLAVENASILLQWKYISTIGIKQLITMLREL